MSEKTGVNQKREALIDCYILLHTSKSLSWKNKEENTERHYALDVPPMMTITVEGLMREEQIRNSLILCVVGYSLRKKEKTDPPI